MDKSARCARTLEAQLLPEANRRVVSLHENAPVAHLYFSQARSQRILCTVDDGAATSAHRMGYCSKRHFKNQHVLLRGAYGDDLERRAADGLATAAHDGTH